MAIKVSEKPLAKSINEDFQLLILQKENDVQSLRRISEANYEWARVPLDIRLSIAAMINGYRQQSWQIPKDIQAAITALNASIMEEISEDRNRLSSLESWKTKHTTQLTGTVNLTNTEEYPFNNSEKSVSIANQGNSNYIVLTDVVNASGNVGEIILSDKLNNGFKVSYTGSAASAKIRYTVIGGFAS